MMFHPVGGVLLHLRRKTFPSMNITKKFDSLTAFASWLDTAPLAGYFSKKPKSCQSHKEDNADWYGTANYEEAQNLMLSGWHEGAERVRACMADHLSPKDGKRVCNSVVGFAPNVPAYIVGAPASMISKKTIKTPRRVVSIVYNCAVGASVSASEVENAAATLFNVVAGLESSGVRVELWVCSFSIDEDLNNTVSMAVRIKTASQPFNLLKMVFPMVHPSFNRRFKFALIERIGVDSKFKYYGAVINNRNKMATMAKNIGINANACFSFDTINGKTEKEIADMIK